MILDRFLQLILIDTIKRHVVTSSIQSCSGQNWWPIARLRAYGCVEGLWGWQVWRVAIMLRHRYPYTCWRPTSKKGIRLFLIADLTRSELSTVLGTERAPLSNDGLCFILPRVRVRYSDRGVEVLRRLKWIRQVMRKLVCAGFLPLTNLAKPLRTQFFVICARTKHAEDPAVHKSYSD